MANKGYDNAACSSTNVEIGVQTPNVEMKRVVAANGAGMKIAKCCGSSAGQFPDAPAGGSDVPPNVCLPKCPAVKLSPWDPVKTRLAAVLTAAMLVWLLMGAYIVKF